MYGEPTYPRCVICFVVAIVETISVTSLVMIYSTLRSKRVSMWGISYSVVRFSFWSFVDAFS